MLLCYVRATDFRCKREDLGRTELLYLDRTGTKGFFFLNVDFVLKNNLLMEKGTNHNCPAG